MIRARTIGLFALTLLASSAFACASKAPPPVFVRYDQAADKPKSDDDIVTIGAAFCRLEGDEKLSAAIIGYASAEGDVERNKELSFRRASAVREALVRHGVGASRITVAARGVSDPVASNNTEEGRALNRRVEIFFYYPSHGDLKAQYGVHIELEGEGHASAGTK